jgi:cell division protein FtsI (penicillin-binding protein 3)
MFRKKSPPLKKDARAILKVRLMGIACLFLLFGAAVSSRLFYLQIINHDELVALSKKQYADKEEIVYGRGIIYDRNQNTLAMNIEVESVHINPSRVKDKKYTARILASHLNMDRKKLFGDITSRQRPFWVKRKCNLDEVKKLHRFELPGVRFISEQKRVYPKRELAANITGIVGIDDKGFAGTEYFHQSILKGTTVHRVIEKDARGRNIRSVSEMGKAKSKSRDVVLTIDEVIQFITEHHLKKQVEKYQADSGMALVMEPYTGEVYAMANFPQFNPNKYQAYKKEKRRNRIITHSYEPGSIFKPITAAAALDSGEIQSPDALFFCENGRFRIKSKTYREAANHKFDWLSLQGIIAKSSNIGSIKIAQTLGPDSFYKYIRKFGFGKKTGIDLPGESAGLLKMRSKWSGLSLPSISFGHEIGVTPIQMASAWSAIANGGNLVLPQVTKLILKNGQVEKSFKPKIIRRVISEKTSRQMIEVLKNAVKNGTGSSAAVPGFETAGKTGTAQMFDKKSGTYFKNKYLASFVGFVPADAPKIVVLVMIENPRKSHYGATVAGPVFKEISKEVLRYLNEPAKDELVFYFKNA